MAVTASPDAISDRVTRSKTWLDHHWRSALVVALLLIHGILAWQSRAIGIETGNDDAWYVLLARSLRHLNYSDYHLLGAPAHSQYPPGYPALIALVTVVFGERIDVVQVVVVACSVLSLAVLHDAIVRRSGPTVALTVLALCALNPGLVEFAGKVMSETPYLLFSAITVWAVIRETSNDRERGATSRRWTWIAIAGAVAAALTRTFGLTLIAAVGLTWVLQRRYRDVFALIVVATLTIGAWMTWTIVAPDQLVGRSYIADATFHEDRSDSMIEAFAKRASRNVIFYAARAIPSALPQPTLGGTPVDNIAGLIVVSLLIAAGVWVIWKQARIVVLYLGASATLLVLWTWSVDRFLVPLLPFLLWLLISGAFAAAKRRWLRPLPYVVAAIIVGSAVAAKGDWLRAAWSCERDVARTSPACFSAPQRGFFAAAEFARENTPDTARFFTVRHATFGLLSQRRVLHPSRLRSTDSTELLSELRTHGVEFVLVSALLEPEAQRVSWLIHNCGALLPIREFVGLTLLMRVAEPATTLAPTACADLQRFVRHSRIERERARLHPRVPGNT